MRLGLVAILLIYMCNIKGQNINIQTVIERVFCDSSHTFNHQNIYIVENSSDSFFDYNGVAPKCVNLIVCKSQEDLLKNLRKEKEILILTFREIDTNNSDEKEYIFSINKAHLKGNRKKLRLFVHQDSYQVTFSKNTQTKNWEISKVKYPTRLDSIRSK